MREHFDKERSAIAEYKVRVSISAVPPIQYEELPDLIFEDVEGPIKWTETLDENGLHHSFLDQYSVTALDLATNRTFLKCRHFKGLLHSNNDLPSIDALRHSGNLRIRVWHDFGSPHRDENVGAAEIHEWLDTGIISLENYLNHGKDHCTFGPAWIERDPDTGRVTEQQFSDPQVSKHYNKS